MKHGVKHESLSWVEAERWFVTNPLVVMPLGAAAKEHGPHLPLNKGGIIAEHLLQHCLQCIDAGGVEP
jgi:creatinine amidohydrolase